jgi:hypothetical protein
VLLFEFLGFGGFHGFSLRTIQQKDAVQKAA